MFLPHVYILVFFIHPCGLQVLSGSGLPSVFLVLQVCWLRILSTYSLENAFIPSFFFFAECRILIWLDLFCSFSTRLTVLWRALLWVGVSSYSYHCFPACNVYFSSCILEFFSTFSSLWLWVPSCGFLWIYHIRHLLYFLNFGIAFYLHQIWKISSQHISCASPLPCSPSSFFWEFDYT